MVLVQYTPTSGTLPAHDEYLSSRLMTRLTSCRPIVQTHNIVPWWPLASSLINAGVFVGLALVTVLRAQYYERGRTRYSVHGTTWCMRTSKNRNRWSLGVEPRRSIGSSGQSVEARDRTTLFFLSFFRSPHKAAAFTPPLPRHGGHLEAHLIKWGLAVLGLPPVSWGPLPPSSRPTVTSPSPSASGISRCNRALTPGRGQGFSGGFSLVVAISHASNQSHPCTLAPTAPFRTGT